MAEDDSMAEGNTDPTDSADPTDPAGLNDSSDPVDDSLLPGVILMQPQMGENIGAAARAMKNCGLMRLHIVAPRDGWPNAAAASMAAGGADILTAARLHETLREAASDYTLIGATTARRRGMAKPALDPMEAARRMRDHAKAGGRPALLFGPERAGLDNDSVGCADFIITVPLNPQFASLNLGHAVLLMGWEARKAVLTAITPDSATSANPATSPKASTPTDDALRPSTAEERAFLFDTLQKHLWDGGFFTSPDMMPVVMRNIMALFQRADLTAQDVRTLHGMIKALQRSGQRSG